MLALALVAPPCAVEAFGIATPSRPQHHQVESSTTRAKTSLASGALAPPAQHMEWLHRQDDLERRSQRKARLQQPQKKQVLPLTLFGTEVPTASCNSTSSSSTAKEAWAASFTTVEALRDTFGRNKNAFWGDLDASTTRRLYKTLLPRALLELYHCEGASSEDLAPLAYRARVAAKKYARERSEVPARVAASLFDGWRQFCKYGRFQSSGMSYPQLWEKYATQIMEEDDFENEQDLTSKVCYKILEKSCETNQKVDSLFLTDQQDLQEITLKLEQDVYDLLDNEPEDVNMWAIRRYQILRTLLRIRRQMEGRSYTEHDDNAAMQAVLEDAAQQ